MASPPRSKRAAESQPRLRPAARGEGRLSQLTAPRGTRVGDPVTFVAGGTRRRAIFEGGDIAGWDLGPAAEEEEVAALIGARVSAALARRASLLPASCNVYRAVHDAADALPGVAIDIFDDVAVCQLYGAAYVAHVDAIAAPLRERGLTVRVALRGRGGARSDGFDRWYGDPPRGRCVLERGLRFWVRFDGELLGTGLFPDQREQRARVRELAAGRRALNLFAYAGGFTVAAAAGGAETVDHVDLSRACLGWAARNLCLNGLDPRRHRFVAEDARDFIARAARGGRRYQLLVVDPPTFATGRRPFRLTRDLAPLLRGCAPLLDPGAVALVSANTRGLEGTALVEEAQAALGAGGQDVVLLGEGGQGFDHPVPAAGSPLRHLKAAWFLVD